MMKRFFLLILLVACIVCVANRTEKWREILAAQGMEISLVVHIQGGGPTQNAQLDKPRENFFAIPGSDPNFENSTFNIVIANLKFRSAVKEIAGWVLKQTN
jgi:hypothetical protein